MTLPSEADIVIVGGGSAGCVLAARLSEDPSLRVVLLEAGDQNRNLVRDIPGFTMALMGNPRVDWNYPAEPDPTLNGRSLVWHAGKMTGGSSSINGLVYIRGLRRDYDEWARLGCTGWGWDDLEPWFRKVEGFAGEGADSLGREGPLSLSHIASPHALTRPFVEACDQAGIGRAQDYNCGGNEGAFLNLTNQRNGTRVSTARAWLEPALKRPNLTVIRGALAERVIITDGRASGVRFRFGNDVCSIAARREVIVSAGTMHSPALLMRSGIGPAEDLRAIGIDVTVDSPGVGRNLQDHSGTMIGRFVDVPTYNSEMGPFSGVKHLFNYLLFKRGPLASSAVQAMAWARSDPALPEPDIHLNWFPFGVDYNVSPPVMYKQPCVSLGVCISRPHSRGRIVLANADPATLPTVRHHMFEDERDMATLVRSLPLLERIFEAPALARHVVGRTAPFVENLPPDNVEEAIRASAGLGLHAVGTCRMGSDAAAVVDPSLRVHGIAGLRVADCSIFPRQISANTNAAAMMIGEKAASLVLTGLKS